MTEYLQLGQAAINAKNISEAVEWFEKAVTEAPRDAQAIACLGQSLCWQGRRSDGVIHLRKAGAYLLKKARKSRDVSLAISMVEQLQYWNDYQGALELNKQVVQVNRNDVRGFQLLALTYSRLNYKKQALDAGRQALKLQPDSVLLSIMQATLEMAIGQNDVAKKRLVKILKYTTLNSEEKFRAHKELAKLLDKLGDYNQVFEHLHASTLAASQLPEVKNQNIALVPQMIKENINGFDKDLLQKCAKIEFQQDNPQLVFLVGFMRSGTTLTQEVFASHPDAFVADETDFIPSVRTELSRITKGIGSISDKLKKLDLSQIEHLRQFYWDKVHMHYGNKITERVFLDKTTMNTIDLGLINCVFPDAKVIFVMRDPRDVCLSCFMQIMIPTPSTVHLFSWQGTTEFYALIMNWWMFIKKRMTMDFIEFRYEDAVSQFEETYQRVFSFLGLTWEASVVDFHKHAKGKFIGSPSFGQVAQPLYSSSVARWKHYQAEFESVSELLQPFVSEFGYSDSE